MTNPYQNQSKLAASLQKYLQITIFSCCEPLLFKQKMQSRQNLRSFLIVQSKILASPPEFRSLIKFWFPLSLVDSGISLSTYCIFSVAYYGLLCYNGNKPEFGVIYKWYGELYFYTKMKKPFNGCIKIAVLGSFPMETGHFCCILRLLRR